MNDCKCGHDAACPHCGHGWDSHDRRCVVCGCQWKKPQEVTTVEPPSAHALLVERVTDALWSAFEAADNCYTDRKMDIIDTGGNYAAFSMSQVAEAVIAAIDPAVLSPGAGKEN